MTSSKLQHTLLLLFKAGQANILAGRSVGTYVLLLKMLLRGKALS